MAAPITIDRAHVANLALMALGQPANYSLADSGKKNGIVDLAWTATEDEAFGLHDWTWMTERDFRANRVDEKAQHGYAYTYEVPGDIVGAIRRLTWGLGGTTIREFELAAGRIYCSVEPVYVTAVMRSDPDRWEGTFRRGFASLLASNLAVPLLQDMDLKMTMRAEALGSPSERQTGGILGRAMSQDRAARPRGFRHAPDPLTSARFS